MESPKKRICALVNPMDGVQNPNLIFQVTIDPEKVHGEFIRFGDWPGDELVGWKYLFPIKIIHVIGTVDDKANVTVADTSLTD